jgi:hypothetical protein
MVLGAWVSKVISDISRFNVPDVIKQRGALTARGCEALTLGAIQRIPVDYYIAPYKLHGHRRRKYRCVRIQGREIIRSYKTI